MKNSILCAFLVAVLGLNVCADGGEKSSLSEHLEPFRGYLGEWKMCWTDPNGHHMSGHASIKPDAGGSVVIMKTELTGEDGKPYFTRLSIFHWNSESKSLAELNFVSDGGFGANVLKDLTGAKWIWAGHSRSDEGKEGNGNTEMIKVDENTWTAQFTHQVFDGKPLPNSPKLTFTRVK